MEGSSQNIGKYSLHQYRGSEEFISLLDSIPLAVFYPVHTTRYLKFVFFSCLALSNRGLPERVRTIAWGRILIYGWRTEVPRDHYELAVTNSEVCLSECGVPQTFTKLDTLEAMPDQVRSFIVTYFHQDHHKRIKDLLDFLSYLATHN